MTQSAIQSSDGLAEKMRQAKDANDGLTFAKIGTALNVDPRTVAGWVAQPPRSRPSYDRLRSYAKVTGKPLSFFFEDDDEAAA